MVLVDIRAFRSSDVKSRFEKLRSAESKRPPLLQVVVAGRLECKQRLGIVMNTEGEIVGGDAFGDYGLAKCRIQSGELQFMYELE